MFLFYVFLRCVELKGLYERWSGNKLKEEDKKLDCDGYWECLSICFSKFFVSMLVLKVYNLWINWCFAIECMFQCTFTSQQTRHFPLHLKTNRVSFSLENLMKCSTIHFFINAKTRQNHNKAKSYNLHQNFKYLCQFKVALAMTFIAFWVLYSEFERFK